MQGQTSMLMCARAMFLTSSQMESLCRSEMALTAALSYIKSSDTSELTRLLTYVESPGECSAREAVSLLRSLTRRP